MRFFKHVLIAAFLVVLATGFASAQNIAEINRAIEREEYSKAMNLINQAIASDPKNGTFYELKGEVYFQTEQYSEARGAYEQASRFNRNQPEPYIGLGKSLIASGNLEKGAEYLEQAKELNKTDDVNVNIAIANAYLQSDNAQMISKAKVLLTKVTSVEKDNLYGYIALGDLYSKQKVDELALENYRHAVRIDPNFMKGYLRIGQIKVKMGDYQAGADTFMVAMKLDPEFSPVYREMAELWYKAGKYKQAMENYEKYVQKTGNDLGAKIRYGSFAFLNQEYQKSIDILEPLLKDTSSVVMLRLLGYSYAQAGKGEKSLEYMDKYFREMDKMQRPKLADDWEYYGRAYLAMGQDSMAMVYYRKAIEMDEKKKALFAELSKKYQEDKAWDKQAAVLEEYLKDEKNPGLGDLFALGRAHYLLRNYEQADSVFEVMTVVRPDLHIGFMWRGKMNVLMDPEMEEEKATPYFEKVLELMGDEESQKKYLKDYIEANGYFISLYVVKNNDCEGAQPYIENVLKYEPENERAVTAQEFCAGK